MKNIKSKNYNGFRLIILVIASVFIISGCTLNNDVFSPSEAGSVIQTPDFGTQNYEPAAKANGEKYRIGMLDIDEYEPASIYFYYVLQGLRNLGWIEFTELPFTDKNMDVKLMMQELSKMDLGPYIEFVGDAVYYLGYEEGEDIEAGIKGHIESKDGLDIILAMGTWPGQFMKDIDLEINTLVCMATDPIESGIINSAQDSGHPLIWAQVEPDPYYRQIKFYHNILPFENIGMVYTDPIVAGIPNYDIGAKELGINITKVELDMEDLIIDGKDEFDSQALLNIYKDMIANNDIDAYMLNADLIKGDMELSYFLEPFKKAGIPVFVQDGENYVSDGAFVLVASTDNRGVGQFVAQVISRVLKGDSPGDLDCEYVSSPYISINLDAAEAIDFRPSFELLLACESIYSKNTPD